MIARKLFRFRELIEKVKTKKGNQVYKTYNNEKTLFR